MNIFDFISSYFFFDKIGLFTFLSVILLSYFTVYSLRKNQCITYYPFLAAIWFLTLILEFTCDNLVLNNLFNHINTDIILFYYGDIILPISLIVYGIVLLFINHWKKPVYEKIDWKECIILSPFPIALLYSAIAYRGDAFIEIPLLVFITAVVIDKIILILDTHYFIHTGLKILFLLIVFKWSETRILAQLLIVITDCMFGYVILQFISSIRWKRSKKGLTKE